MSAYGLGLTPMSCGLVTSTYLGCLSSSSTFSHLTDVTPCQLHLPSAIVHRTNASLSALLRPSSLPTLQALTDTRAYPYQIPGRIAYRLRLYLSPNSLR
jgi:hypothetical protein